MAREPRSLADEVRSTSDGNHSMGKLLRGWWSDETGFIVSAELVLVATVGVIGIVAGLSAVSCAVVSEFDDISAAFTALNQSFSTPTFVGTCGGLSACKLKSFTAGSAFTDLRATQTVALSGATFVGGPMIEAPIVAPPVVQPPAPPCETPVPTVPVAAPCEVRQPVCVTCVICCQPCPVDAGCPVHGTVVPALPPGLQLQPSPLPPQGLPRPKPEAPPTPIPQQPQ